MWLSSNLCLEQNMYLRVLVLWKLKKKYKECYILNKKIKKTTSAVITTSAAAVVIGNNNNINTSTISNVTNTLITKYVTGDVSHNYLHSPFG